MKQLPRFDPLFQLNVNAETDFKELKKNFEAWLEEHRVVTISTADLTIADVFDDYFNYQPPFEKGKKDKKSEFPDAFTLHAMVKYFTDKGQRCYFISGDAGVNKFQHDRLIMNISAVEILETVATTYENVDIKKLIEVQYRIKKEKILDKVTTKVREYVEFELQSKTEARDKNYIGVDRVIVTYKTVRSRKITDASNSVFSMVLTISFKIEVTLAIQTLYLGLINGLIPLPQVASKIWDVDVEVYISGEYDLSRNQVNFKTYEVSPFSIIEQLPL